MIICYDVCIKKGGINMAKKEFYSNGKTNDLKNRLQIITFMNRHSMKSKMVATTEEAKNWSSEYKKYKDFKKRDDSVIKK